MNKLLLCALSLASLMTAMRAHAQAPYAGVTYSTSGDLTLKRNGVTEESDRNNALKLFGGYQFNKHLSVEGGYARVGEFTFPSGPRVSLNAVYVAAKGSIPLGDTFSLYGKLGVAHQGQRVTGLGAADGTSTNTGPMLGLGAAWHLTDKLSLSLEAAGYGTIKSKAGQIKNRQLELGISHSFR